MDRKNTWILGGAIVLGFLVFGLSQSWAQRFPGDGRVGGVENMVGRYQVVRSSPETVLLLDTVTGELYSAGRDDIRPTSARHRGGDLGAGPPLMREKLGDKMGKGVKRGFIDKADFRDAGPIPFPKEDRKDAAPFDDKKGPPFDFKDKK
jgi:hypothetical protein